MDGARKRSFGALYSNNSVSGAGKFYAFGESDGAATYTRHGSTFHNDSLNMTSVLLGQERVYQAMQGAACAVLPHILVDEADNLTTDTLLAGFFIGHHTVRGRDYRDS